MKCLVLAAGRGRRLSGFRLPKPLIPVLGLPLIERSIATVAEAGITEFVVVTGHRASEIEPFLAELAARRGLDLSTIRNDDWERGNGTSVLAARDAFTDDFVLVMADDVFDPMILTSLLAHRPAPGEIVAAVDFALDGRGTVDPSDATKLVVRDDRVEAIGKDLAEFNAFDTGIFVCSPALFAAVDASVRGGDASLAGGIRVVAACGKARIVDVGDHYWVDVDTPLAIRAARGALRRSVIKPHDSLVSRRINRPISTRLITPSLLRLAPGVTPNQVSFLGLVVAIGAAVSFAAGLPVLAGIAVMLASLLDGSDGEIARLGKVASPLGTFVDAVLDRYADAFMLAGAGAYVLTSRSESVWSGHGWLAVAAVVTTLAVTGHLMVSYTSARSVVDLGTRYRGRFLAAGRGRDARLLVLSLGGLLAGLDPIAVVIALAVIAVGSNAIVIARLWISWRLGQPGGTVAHVGALVFDFDGTLADSMPFLMALATDILENAGMAPAEARRRYQETVGVDFAAQLDEILPGRPENERDAAAFEVAKRAGILVCRPFPDVRPALAFFRERGIGCFVCSSTSPDIVAGYLSHWRLEPWLLDWTGFEPGFAKGAQIAALLRRHQLRPDAVLYVGDAPRDHRLVADAGVHFMALHRLFPRSEFRRRGLGSVRDLRRLARRWERSEWLRTQID